MNENSRSHLEPEQLFESFKNLGPAMTVTHQKISWDTRCQANDLDWNHMDHLHRLHIHHTYLEGLRIATGARYSVRASKMRFLGIPLIIQVTDVQLRPGLFYQSMTLLGLFYVHVVTRSRDGCSFGDWYIVSHRWLKFLHPVLLKRFNRLNRVQNIEDDVAIRSQRTELRKRGFRFRVEDHDFLTANSLKENVLPPSGKYEFSLSETREGEIARLSSGPIEILVRRDGADKFSVWGAVCPHEGGNLRDRDVCGREIKCGWHGLKFRAAELSSKQSRGRFGRLAFELRQNLVLCVLTSE